MIKQLSPPIGSKGRDRALVIVPDIELSDPQGGEGLERGINVREWHFVQNPQFKALCQSIAVLVACQSASYKLNDYGVTN